MYSNDSLLDDFQSSSLLFLSDRAMPPNHVDNSFEMFNSLNDDTNHSNAFADDPPESEGIDGLDKAQFELFYKNYFNEIDLSMLLTTKNSVQDNPPIVEENSTKSFVVKSSETKNQINFINVNGFINTGSLLQLAIPPFSYQRARYENELDDIFRYIFVPNNGLITLKIFDRLDDIAPRMSGFLRITRLIIPYGPENLILYHPYPIWLNDKDAKVHNGSLFIAIINKTIEIEKLILQRSKQDVLGKIQHFPIFTSNQLDFNNFHATNTSKAKDLIKKYQLQYCILHFQIIFVDQNNQAYPTDLECQTEPIYEYEGKELKNFSPDVRNIMGQSIKRKRIGERKESSINIKKKKLNKKNNFC